MFDIQHNVVHCTVSCLCLKSVAKCLKRHTELSMVFISRPWNGEKNPFTLCTSIILIFFTRIHYFKIKSYAYFSVSCLDGISKNYSYYHFASFLTPSLSIQYVKINIIILQPYHLNHYVEIVYSIYLYFIYFM